MPKKQPNTPRSRVRDALRRLWLRSRERAACLKRDGYACQVCHKKQSRAKGKELVVNVHHLDGIEWERLIDLVYERLLCNPENLITLCESCHDETEKHAANERKDTKNRRTATEPLPYSDKILTP